MNLRSFTLKPFRGEEHRPEIRVTGTVRRTADRLRIGYALLGELSEIAIPAPVGMPGRKDRLWEETCMELFLGRKDSGRYWEFNLSPAGHWNVYRFASYRRGKREEPAFSSLPFRVLPEPDALRFSMDLELGRILPAGSDIEIGVCAVIRTKTGRTSYWALAHPGSRPDFHRRDGFALTIPGE